VRLVEVSGRKSPHILGAVLANGARIAISPREPVIDMIEFVGFDVSSDPQRTAVPLRVPLEWPMLVVSASVTTGGVAWIAPGESSIPVAVDVGYPAITASLIGGDIDLGVAAVSLDGAGTATIHLNRSSGSDVQVVWFVVQTY
jgi:hypothetical protein